MLILAATPWRPLDGTPCPASEPNERWVLDRLASPPDAVRAAIDVAGLQTAEVDDNPVAQNLFGRAVELIACVPDLHRTIAATVEHIHPLAAEPGYDVSHSEPRWATRIFVSIPDRADVVGALRLAEGITHESMHLLLTNWEKDQVLVADTAVSLHSPWRQTPRPAQGVLHGTFVFVCISAFFARLDQATLGLAGASHVRKRLDTIRDELDAVDLAGLSSMLTSRGSTALNEWLAEGGNPT